MPWSLCPAHWLAAAWVSLLYGLTCNGRNWGISDHQLWGQNTQQDLCYHHPSSSASKKTSDMSFKREHTLKRFSVLPPASVEVVAHIPFSHSCQDHCHTLPSGTAIDTGSACGDDLPIVVITIGTGSHANMHSTSMQRSSDKTWNPPAWGCLSELSLKCRPGYQHNLLCHSGTVILLIVLMIVKP